MPNPSCATNPRTADSSRGTPRERRRNSSGAGRGSGIPSSTWPTAVSVERYRSLGASRMQVSELALGTMTWGEQNTEAEGHAQIDYALDQGVNLIDTAEMYSVPPHAETYGSTERIIGTWLKKSRKRDKIVLCTKVAGRPTEMLDLGYVRGGRNVLDRRNIF